MPSPRVAQPQPAGPLLRGAGTGAPTRPGVTGTGPVLVVTDPGNPFTDDVCGALLPTEGFTGCTHVDARALDRAVDLTRFEVLVLADRAPVSQGQVARLTAWVRRGGVLIALRPLDALDGLLGLAPRTGVQDGGYLQMNRSQASAAGLTDRPLQVHGEADVRQASGARVVAHLRASASAPDGAPAVTEHPFGSGTASAWAFDPARSILLTRDGDPALTGRRTTSIDGRIRMMDRFGNGFQDPSLLSLPQADVVLHLLANQVAAAGVPRLWYLPTAPDGSLRRAAVVLTGDDHAGRTETRTIPRFRMLAGKSPPTCSVEAWTCLRATSYALPGAFTDAQVAGWTRQGFEVGPHIANGDGCTTPGAAAAAFVRTWEHDFPSESPPVTTRWHCYGLWNDYAGVPRADAAAGIRADASTACWPEQAFGGGPCFIGGSTLPMSFTDEDGTLTGVLQFPTQATDENPGTATREGLDQLLGSPYPGFYTVLAHLDDRDISNRMADDVVSLATSLRLPVISAKQATEFWLGRARSDIGLRRSGDTDRITVTAKTSHLALLVPLRRGDRRVARIASGGDQVPVRTTSVDGTAYAATPVTDEPLTVTYR